MFQKLLKFFQKESPSQSLSKGFDSKIQGVGKEWDDFSGFYCQHIEPMGLSTGIQLAEVINARNAKNGIVEISCGSGLLTRFIALNKEPECPFYSFDVSPEMVRRTIALFSINQAREDHKRASLDKERLGRGPRAMLDSQEAFKEFQATKTTIAVGNGEQLPLKDEEVGAVIGNLVLHFTPNPEQMLKESFRVLKPGGKMAFSVWSSSELGLLFKAFKCVSTAFDPPETPSLVPIPKWGFKLGRQETLTGLAESAGFKELRSWNVYAPICYQKKEEIVGLLECLPSSQRAEELQGKEKTREKLKEISDEVVEMLRESRRPLGFESRIIFGVKE